MNDQELAAAGRELSRERELHRLIGLYQITRDGETLTITSEIEAVRLLNDTMHAACAYLFRQASLRDERHLDDSEDYTNAASGQISWILDKLHSLELDLIETVNEIINAHDSQVEAADADCFRYGFADHGTPLSDLMHINRDDECCDAGCNVYSAYDDQDDTTDPR